MDLEILKKKLSSFKGEGGRVTKVSDELLIEILTAWENWTGNRSCRVAMPTTIARC